MSSILVLDDSERCVRQYYTDTLDGLNLAVTDYCLLMEDYLTDNDQDFTKIDLRRVQLNGNKYGDVCYADISYQDGYVKFDIDHVTKKIMIMGNDREMKKHLKSMWDRVYEPKWKDYRYSNDKRF